MEIVPHYSAAFDVIARHHLLWDRHSGDVALLDCPPAAVEADLDFILAQDGVHLRQIFLSHASLALQDAAERLALLVPEAEVIAPFWGNWDISAQEYPTLGTVSWWPWSMGGGFWGLYAEGALVITAGWETDGWSHGNWQGDQVGWDSLQKLCPETRIFVSGAPHEGFLLGRWREQMGTKVISLAARREQRRAA
ncbi:MAG: hypothetical protein AB7C98_01240 [Acidithiobacillus sp.]